MDQQQRVGDRRPGVFLTMSGQVRSKGMHGIHTLQWLQGEEPRWILVVEKEGVFHRLVEENFSEYVVMAYK